MYHIETVHATPDTKIFLKLVLNLGDFEHIISKHMKFMSTYYETALGSVPQNLAKEKSNMGSGKIGRDR